MTYVYNDPDDFKDDVLRGFAAAYPSYVDRVKGASGFVRAGGPLEGKVSLVVGGGSGHYPSYNGVVGAGFADGAVLGDLFASPSAEQVYRVARAAHGGAGIVLGFGNYAGDRLNFTVAADRLIAEGIDTRIVYVTDDIASAPPAEQHNRRGIAGTFTVYKVAAAAAEGGADLYEVERVMRAVALAHKETGAPITVHTHPGSQQGLAVKKVLDAEVVDPRRVVLGHSGDSSDADHLSELADAGFLLGMDRFGINLETTFEARADIVVELCRRGYAESMVLSQDAACYIDWIEPGVMALLPDWKYTHIHERVVPYLLEHGVPQDQVDTMLVTNPRRYFEGASA